MNKLNHKSIRDTPLFKKLLSDAAAIEADFYAFKKKYRKLWNADHEAKVIILQCHLILEMFLSDYLKQANPAAYRIDKVQLSFAQKLELAYNPQANFAFLIDGMRALNILRNKFAHRIGYTLAKDDISPMKDALKIWYDAGGKTMPEGLGVVLEFTELVCGFLDGTIQSIKRHGDGAGLQGLINWYK